MCGVKLNLMKYYLHDKLPNESIISMLGNAKMLENNNDNSKKHNNFFIIFSMVKVFPLRSATNCEAAISAIQTIL